MRGRARAREFLPFGAMVVGRSVGIPHKGSRVFVSDMELGIAAAMLIFDFVA